MSCQTNKKKTVGELVRCRKNTPVYGLTEKTRRKFKKKKKHEQHGFWQLV